MDSDSFKIFGEELGMRKVSVACLLILFFMAANRLAFCGVGSLTDSYFSDSKKSKISRKVDEKVSENLKFVNEKNEIFESDKFFKTKQFIKRACTGGTIFGIILLLISKNQKIYDLLFSTLKRTQKFDTNDVFFQNFDQSKPKNNTALVSGIVKNLPILMEDLKKSLIHPNMTNNQFENVILNDISDLNSGAIKTGNNLNSQIQSLVLQVPKISVTSNLVPPILEYSVREGSYFNHLQRLILPHRSNRFFSSAK